MHPLRSEPVLHHNAHARTKSFIYSLDLDRFNCQIKLLPLSQLLPPLSYKLLLTLEHHFFQFPSADIFLTTSTTALKLNGSYIANPLKIFLSNLTPLFPSIWINLEYDNPCCLTPAFNLCIHNFRNSRFLTFLSLYAYCHDFSRRRIATRKHRLARPRKPLESLMTRLCFFDANPRAWCCVVTDEVPKMMLLFIAKLVLANTLRVIKLFIVVPLLMVAADGSDAIEPIDLAAVRFDVLFLIVIFKPLNRRGKVSAFAALPNTGTNRRDIWLNIVC